MLHKVNCDHHKKEQVVYCDRVRARKDQVLRSEGTEQKPSDSPNAQIELEEQDDEFGLGKS